MMSVRIAGSSTVDRLLNDATDFDGSSSSSDQEPDENWDDFSDDAAQSAQSLFDATPAGTFRSVQGALTYDKDRYGFDLKMICTRLGLSCG